MKMLRLFAALLLLSIPVWADVTVNPNVGTSNANTTFSYYLTSKAAVRIATAVALPANTRTGNILLADANGAIAGHASMDGLTPAVGDRVLVKDEATGANNGIYVFNAIGTASAKWQMTRAEDADQTNKVLVNILVPVSEGTANADTEWVLTTNATITLNTTALTFTKLSATPAGAAGGDLTGTYPNPTIAAGAVTEAKMTLADNTTNNASISAHGFLKKLPNDAMQTLFGTGSYGAITEAKLTLADNTTGNVGVGSHGFAPKGSGTTTNYWGGDWTEHAITSNPRSSTFTVTSSGGDYTTMQGALDALPAAGGSVYFTGTLSITVTITLPNKPVHIFGDGKGSIIDLGSNAIQAFTHSNDVRHTFSNFHIKGDVTAGQGGFYSTVADTSTTESGCHISNVTSYGLTSWVKDNGVLSYMTSVGCHIGLSNTGYYGNGNGVYFFDSCIGVGTSSASSCGGFTAAGNPGPYMIHMSNCRFAFGKVSIVGHFFASGCDLDGDGGGFTQDPNADGYYMVMTGCHYTASGATAWTVKGRSPVITGNTFVGVNTFTISGANFTFSSNSAHTTNGVLAVVSGANGIVTGNHMRDAAGTTRCLDVQAGATGITVTGNVFLNGSADEVRTASTGGTYFGNTFANAVAVVETGSADSNDYRGPGLNGSTIIGASSTINGTQTKGGTGTSTNALVTIAGSFTDLLGTPSIVGTLKNTDGANSLDYKISVTDLFGTSDTVTATLTFGQQATFTDDGYITGGGTRTLGIGTARAPFKTWKLEVIDTVLNTHATYSRQVSIGGR